MSRILVIGLDGADLDVVKPLVSQGALPNLGRLMAEGAWGELRSTYPPMSPPAWTTFMTGKNPGKHGIFDFTIRKPDSYDVEFVNARFRKAATMWRLMSDAGKRVCILSVPITFPPEKLNGIQISGIDTPGVSGGVADPTAVHPPELHGELMQSLGGYLISPNLPALEGRPVEDYVAAAYRTIDRKMESARDLYAKERWDCFMITIGETDGMSHRMWHYHERECPMGDEASRAWKGVDPVRAVYERIDGHIGTLLGLADAETTVFVVSDHGHAGNGTRAIYLNRWLHQGGFLSFESGSGRRWLSALLRLAKKAGTRNLVPLKIRKKLFRAGLAGTVESYLRFAGMDWSRTRAYSEETPYYPTVWINVKGREPRGIVEPGAEYERVRDEIARKLEAWTDPQSGRRLVKKAHRREEIYAGDHLERIPDLIIEWNLDGEYSYLFRASRASDAGDAPVTEIPRHEKSKAKSGDHRDNGLLMAAGAHVVRAGELPSAGGATLADIAPTFLYRLGLPVPEDMDGRVLTSLFDSDYVRQHPLQRGGGSAVEGSDEPSSAEYSQEEEEAVRKRLQGLGYLE
jgi:predicted AlkP superfamily phosphohydrolase/phosphomutase